MSIKLTIPTEAAELMVSGKRPADALSEFLESKRSKTMALLTFGMYITNIVRTYDDASTEIVGHVVYWGKGIVTCSIVDGSDDVLSGVLENQQSPDQEAALNIWEEFEGRED